MKNISIELSSLNSVNFLWSELIERFGFDKSQKILSQATDLQKMYGKTNHTIPIVFTGTGGSALISINLLKQKLTLENIYSNQVLIFSPKKRLFQIINEIN